jgi:hypothetical protein
MKVINHDFIYLDNRRDIAEDKRIEIQEEK